MGRNEELRAAIATRRVWESFVGGGNPDLSVLAPAIRASWLRSRHLGINPQLPGAPGAAGRDVAEIPAVATPWLVPAEPAFSMLAAVLAAPQQVVLLADAEGRVVRLQVGAEARARAEQLNVRVGADWSEDAVGSTAIGVCLHDGVPAQANWWESYCNSWHDWVAQAVPVRDPLTGKVLAGIDVSGFREVLHPAMLEIMQQAARSIETAIEQADWRSRALLLERFQRVQKTAARNPCFVLDRRGRLLAYNDAAAQRFRLGERDLRTPLEASAALTALLDPSGAVDDGFTRKLRFGTEADSHEADGARGCVYVLPAPGRTLTARSFAPRYSFERIWGGNAAFRSVLERARRLAPTEVPVLLCGETGTGKELVAHAIHSASERAAGPFVAVNCGAIPQELIASELFGYEKGAFTGASRGGRRGKFELASGGTLFLDEITETSAALQVALLRAIQDGEIVPVGAEHGRAVDVRIISATNRDPEAAVAEGVLRKDLFYRLNGAILALPPLRERRDDIAELVARFCAESGRGVTLSPAAMALLLAHDWPGNLRELQAVIRNAAAIVRGATIEPADLPPSLLKRTAAAAPAAAPARDDVPLSLESAEADVIRRALAATGGDVRKAARLLGIGRSSLYRKLQQLKLARTWTQAPRELDS